MVVAALLCLLYLQRGARSAAVKEPPAHLVEGYTMRGGIPLELFYVDDTNGTGTHYSYSSSYIQRMIDGSRSYMKKLESTLAKDQQGYIDVSERSISVARMHKNDWVYLAVLKHVNHVRGGAVAVVGSSEPRVECIAAAANASLVITLEYNELTYGSQGGPSFRTVSKENMQSFCSEHQKTFDVIFSISSIEHDGLGRYGDPLDPDADLAAMARVRGLLKDDGIFMLSVPLGPDVTVFNLHRRYGTVRLPKLLDGWDIAETIPFNVNKLTQSANWRQTYEPVMVLRKSSSFSAPAPVLDETDDETTEERDDHQHEGRTPVVESPPSSSPPSEGREAERAIMATIGGDGSVD